MTLARKSGLSPGATKLQASSGLSRGQDKLRGHLKSAGLRFEQEVAELYEEITGRRAFRQRGSGSVWFRPGDVLTPQFLIECKEHARPVIRREFLERIAVEARAYGRAPLLAFREKETGRTWGVLSSADLPDSDDLPEAHHIVRGGAKQVTVPAGVPKRCYLAFRDAMSQSTALYAVYPLYEVFASAHLWEDGLEIPELSHAQA